MRISLPCPSLGEWRQLVTKFCLWCRDSWQLLSVLVLDIAYQLEYYWVNAQRPLLSIYQSIVHITGKLLRYRTATNCAFCPKNGSLRLKYFIENQAISCCCLSQNTFASMFAKRTFFSSDSWSLFCRRLNTVNYNSSRVKGKGKVHPITCHEDADGEQKYSSIFSLTSALDGD